MQKRSYVPLACDAHGHPACIRCNDRSQYLVPVIIANSLNATNGANSDPACFYFDPLAGPWTFNLTSAGTLQVTDADLNGDYVSVLDSNLAFLPNVQGPEFNPQSNCGLDPTACLADSNFWHLTVALAPKT